MGTNRGNQKPRQMPNFTSPPVASLGEPADPYPVGTLLVFPPLLSFSPSVSIQVHFPRSSGASIINPDIVGPGTSLIPMRATLGCQKSRGREGAALGTESKASPAGPREHPETPGRREDQGSRARKSSSQEPRGVIFHEDLSLGQRHLAETPILSGTRSSRKICNSHRWGGHRCRLYCFVIRKRLAARGAG